MKNIFQIYQDGERYYLVKSVSPQADGVDVGFNEKTLQVVHQFEPTEAQEVISFLKQINKPIASAWSISNSGLKFNQVEKAIKKANKNKIERR